MGRKSKEKGKSGEREVVKLFRAALCGHCDVEEIRRNHQQAEIGGRDLVGVPIYSVEVKRYAKEPGVKAIEGWWEQTCRQAADTDKEPLLIFRADRGRWRVMLWMWSYECETALPAVVEWNQFEIYYRSRLDGQKA